MFIYNVQSEFVKRTIVEPRDNWGGEGLLGADISFGYFNKLPMRKRDILNNQKRQQMKNVFSGIQAGLEGTNQPTMEDVDDDDDELMQ